MGMIKLVGEMEWVRKGNSTEEREHSYTLLNGRGFKHSDVQTNIVQEETFAPGK